MKFIRYVKDKINFILAFIVYSLIILGYTNAMNVDKNVTFFILIISILFL